MNILVSESQLDLAVRYMKLVLSYFENLEECLVYAGLYLGLRQLDEHFMYFAFATKGELRLRPEVDSNSKPCRDLLHDVDCKQWAEEVFSGMNSKRVKPKYVNDVEAFEKALRSRT